MSSYTPSPHVIVSYKDNVDEPHDPEDPHSTLLPSTTSTAVLPSQRRSCWKRLLLAISVLAVAVGIFEVAFHGKEAESLQAAKEKISQLENELSRKFRGGYDRVFSAIAPAKPVVTDTEVAKNESAKDPFEAVKSRSVVLLKTGASVLFDRLPVQLLLAQSSLHPDIHLSGSPTYLGPQFLIYSDYPTTLGPFTIHDALSNVSTYVRNSTEFQPRYTALRQLLDAGEDPSASSYAEGWNLDKWKFLYMWQDAYRRHPDLDWYVGYEADTFVFWESLFRFLSHQDPNVENLWGCAFILTSKQEPFANGGCPYVVSGALMRATFGKDPHFAERFDKEVEKSCCGDAELTIALRKSGSKVIKDLGEAGARFFNGQPEEVLFDGGNWCQPVFNFHHVLADRVAGLANMERDLWSKKGTNETILYRDVFDHVIPHPLREALHSLDSDPSSDPNPTKPDWEAFSSSDNHVSQARRTDTADKCKQQCLKSVKCTVWFWLKVTETDSDGDCYLMHDAVKVGKRYEGTGLRTSGWIANRVASFRAHHACKNPPSA